MRQLRKGGSGGGPGPSLGGQEFSSECAAREDGVVVTTRRREDGVMVGGGGRGRLGRSRRVEETGIGFPAELVRSRTGLVGPLSCFGLQFPQLAAWAGADGN